MGHKSSGLFTGIFLGTVIGGAYSLLFAQKKGSTLRKELQEAQQKGKFYEVLAKELSLTGKESVKAVKELLESEEFQKFMSNGKDKMDEWTNIAKEKGSIYAKDLKKKLESLAAMASEKAKEIQDEMTQENGTLSARGKKNTSRAKGK